MSFGWRYDFEWAKRGESIGRASLSRAHP